ncbi:hypothetical protein INR49_011767 [Caranx melampygus]|nr:hypothetical protein INR49_011767 [Caranx melampygus]
MRAVDNLDRVQERGATMFYCSTIFTSQIGRLGQYNKLKQKHKDVLRRRSETMLFYNTRHGEKILFSEHYVNLLLVDGHQGLEIKRHEPDEDAELVEVLGSLMQGELLPNASVMLTSRPAAINHIPVGCIDRFVLIAGFSLAEVQDFFFCYFQDSTLAEQMFAVVSANELMLTLCYTPAFCYIVCCILKESKELHEEMSHHPLPDALQNPAGPGETTSNGHLDLFKRFLYGILSERNANLLSRHLGLCYQKEKVEPIGRGSSENLHCSVKMGAISSITYTACSNNRTPP